MKSFITEIETGAGNFIGSEYPFKKAVKNGRITTVSYRGRRDAPDIICSIDRINNTTLNLKVTLENKTANAIVIRRIKAAKIFEDGNGLLGSLKPDVWLLRQGTNSPGDDIRCIPIFNPKKLPSQGWSTKEWYKEYGFLKEIASETFAVLKNLRTNKSLLFGFVSLADQQTGINIYVRGDLITVEAVANTGEYLLSPGGSLSSETLQIATGADTDKLIKNYVSAVADIMKPIIPEEVPAGWSSWQYYRRNITEEDVLENIKALKSGRYKIDYVLLDDGFQKSNAEWLQTNKKFPHGLKWLSGKIQEAGYKPGLWIAPLTILENTEIFKKHKDWLVKDKAGNPLKKFSHMGNVYVLDFTVEGACRWLEKLIKTLVKDYGFKYIKLDGPILRYYTGGVFSKQNITPVQVVRKALTIIRKNSKGALIEGEGYYGPSIGLVDVQRTAQDIHTIWPALRNNIQLNLISNYLHGKWWINNPDAFILRDASTPHHYEDNTAENILTKDELQLELTGHMLSGGEVMLTDRMATLNHDRRKLTSIFLPPYGKAAEVMDLFNGEEYPNIFKLEKQGEIWIAVFNWSEKTRTFRIDLKVLKLKKKTLIVKDYWENKSITLNSTVNVRPHAVKLFVFKA